MKKIVVVVIILVVSCCIQLVSCNNNNGSFKDKNVQEGFQLAQKYCISCHLLPEPHLLNKTTWAEHVLPKMGGLLGFRRFASDYITESDTSGIITLNQWKNIVRYYVTQAPQDPLAREDNSLKIEIGLPYFEVEIPEINITNPATTMVAINSIKKEIVFADGLTEHLYTLFEDRISDSISIGIGISGIHENDKRLHVLTMGVLYPSDSKNGKLSNVPTGTGKIAVLVDSLQRPVHATYADLNDDGREEIIICEFGNTTGRLSWFEVDVDGKFSKHVLRAFPGSVKTEVHDFNQDGKPDMIALMAQGEEGFFIFYNEGNGRFKEERVLRFQPSYGSNYFELIDFNNDGFPDILASNGDNGDYPPILKAYHGIRIYLNDGKNKFTEEIFLPANGVGKVIAKDFDADGDFDLASISYFPDYNKTPEESFIYWRNEGGLTFRPYSFPEATAGRWLTMDAKDADGDGDIDIVLGNAKFTLGAIPPDVMRKWDANSPSIVILRNKIR